MTQMKDVKMAKGSNPIGRLAKLSVAFAADATNSLRDALPEFVLRIKNEGAEEVEIESPMQSIRLIFTTPSGQLIPVTAIPHPSKINTRAPLPPSPVTFQSITRNREVTREQPKNISIVPGAEVEIRFLYRDPLVTQALAKLQEEGDSAGSPKVELVLTLTDAADFKSHRHLTSEWIEIKRSTLK